MFLADVVGLKDRHDFFDDAVEHWPTDLKTP
jgi:hypothetical protein